MMKGIFWSHPVGVYVLGGRRQPTGQTKKEMNFDGQDESERKTEERLFERILAQIAKRTRGGKAQKSQEVVYHHEKSCLSTCERRVW